MHYAVVTVGDTYHIGNLSTNFTICMEGKDTWRTRLGSRNETLAGAYSLIMGRNAACPTCENAGSKWQVAFTKGA